MATHIPSRLQAPRPVRKACRDCREVKPNDFQHFGKKWNGSRTEYTTVDVCLTCRNAKISQGMQKKWAARRSEGGDPNAELMRLIAESKKTS